MRTVARLSSALLLVCATQVAAEAAGLFGRWQLNNELSTDVQDTGGGIDLSGANVSTTVTVGGIPLPTGGSRAPSEISKLPSKDPDVLRCA